MNNKPRAGLMILVMATTISIICGAIWYYNTSHIEGRVIATEVVNVDEVVTQRVVSKEFVRVCDVGGTINYQSTSSQSQTSIPIVPENPYINK